MNAAVQPGSRTVDAPACACALRRARARCQRSRRRASPPQASRTVHVTVVSEQGRGGAGPHRRRLRGQGRRQDACKVLEAAPSTEPLSVALLLDDNGSDINEIRAGARGVRRACAGPGRGLAHHGRADGRDGLRLHVERAGHDGRHPAPGLARRPGRWPDPRRRRRRGRRAQTPRGRAPGDRRRHVRRRRVPQPRPAQHVLAALERSRAALHVVAVGKPTLRRMNRAPVESGDAQGDEWTIDENNRNAVLGEGPRAVRRPAA